MKILLIIGAGFTVFMGLRMFIPFYYPLFKKQLGEKAGIKMYLLRVAETLIVNFFIFYSIYKVFFA